MSMKDGVMSMRPLPDGLAVPAGGEVTFAPVGYHLMFIGLKRPLTKGESVPGKLTLEQAGSGQVRCQGYGSGDVGAGPHIIRGWQNLRRPQPTSPTMRRARHSSRWRGTGAPA